MNADSGRWRNAIVSELYAPAIKRGVVSTELSATALPLSAAEKGMIARSWVGFQISEPVDPVLLCDRDALGVLTVWKLEACCWITGLEAGGGIDKLARCTFASVVPGSVSVLLRFGSGRSEAADTFCRGCEEEDDLVVFAR
jgi:hypothetical protein